MNKPRTGKPPTAKERTISISFVDVREQDNAAVPIVDISHQTDRRVSCVVGDSYSNETHLQRRGSSDTRCGRAIRYVDTKGTKGKICQSCLIEASRQRLRVKM